MDIYIHIGSGKTGTTAIQHMFGANHAEFRKLGIFYYLSKTIRDHHHIISYPKADLNDVKQYFQDMKDAFNKSGCTKMLISSENLMGAPKHYQEAIKDFFGDYNVYIIAYFREQTKLIPSHYLQKQKDPDVDPGYSIDEFFVKFRHNFGNEHMAIGRWANVFGDANTIVRIYDKRLFEEGNICYDFLKIFDIDDKSLALTKNFNISLSENLSDLISAIDKEFHDFKIVNKNEEFLQKRHHVIIKTLLEITALESEPDNKDAMLEQLTKLEDKIIQEFPKPASFSEENIHTAFNNVRERIKTNSRFKIMTPEITEIIINHFRESNIEFANRFLDYKSKKIFLENFTK